LLLPAICQVGDALRLVVHALAGGLWQINRIEEGKFALMPVAGKFQNQWRNPYLLTCFALSKIK